jgi:imidazolonepropionase-like amidohydrolase
MYRVWVISRLTRVLGRWLIGAVCCSAVGGIHALAAEDLRIEHVNIVSPERASVIRNASVRIHDGRIAAISSSSGSNYPSGLSSGGKTIDGRGLFLAPGLIDSHVHLLNIPGMTREQEQLHPDIAQVARQQIPRSFLYFGFTTLVDLISTPDAMTRWKSADSVPDTYFCGGAALIDGYPTNYSPEATRYKDMPYFIVEPGDRSSLPAGIDAADHTPEAVIARMKSDGAICVKTFFDRGVDPRSSLPVPRLETIRALVRAAHAMGLPVLLHASSTEAQTYGLDAGVDVMVHGLWNWGEEAVPDMGLTPAVQAVLDRVVNANVGWQPTFRVGMGFRDLLLPSFLSDPMLTRVLPSHLIEWYGTSEGQSFHNRLASGLALASNGDAKAMEAQVKGIYAANFGSKLERTTRYIAEHHGRLLFGTDTPCAPLYSNPPGLNGWWEMQSLTDAGVTPAQIFRAATLSNAQAFRLDRELGTVEVGKRANLLLLRQDPTQTVEAYANIAKVILGGRLLDPAVLVANHTGKSSD